MSVFTFNSYTGLMNVHTSKTQKKRVVVNRQLVFAIYTANDNEDQADRSSQVQENTFTRDSIDRGNMKVASISKNIIAQYEIEPVYIGTVALIAYPGKQDTLNEEISKL